MTDQNKFMRTPLEIFLEFGTGNIACEYFTNKEPLMYIVAMRQSDIAHVVGTDVSKIDLEDADIIFMSFPTEEKALMVLAALCGKTLEECQHKLAAKRDAKEVDIDNEQ